MSSTFNEPTSDMIDRSAVPADGHPCHGCALYDARTGPPAIERRAFLRSTAA